MLQALPLGLVDRSDAGQPAALPRIVPGPLAVHKITPRVSPTIGRREAEFARQRGVTAVAVADQDGTGLNALEHLAGRLAAAMRVDVEPDGVRTLTHPQPGTPSATATPVFPHPPRGLVAPQYAGGHHMRADRRRERFEQPREIAQAIAQRARRDRQAVARHPAGDRAKRALARPALQQQGGPHRDPIGRVREQPRHRGRDHGGRAVAAATVAIAPTADAPRMRHHGDLDKIGLDKSVRGIRLPTPPAAALGRRQFPDLRTHRQRRARRPPRSRTAGLLTAPPWRGGARLPLAASAETVPGIVRTHRLQRAQLLLQRRNPTRQPAALRGPRQRLPQDRIRRAQLRHLATQFAILPAQRRARRPPPGIHRHLFQKPPQTRCLGHRRQRCLGLPAKRPQFGPHRFQLLLVPAMNAGQRTRPATRLDRLPAPILRTPMTARAIASRHRRNVPRQRQHHHRIHYRMPIHPPGVA